MNNVQIIDKIKAMLNSWVDNQSISKGIIDNYCFHFMRKLKREDANIAYTSEVTAIIYKYNLMKSYGLICRDRYKALLNRV